MPEIRQAAVAGSFYPANPRDLREVVSRHLARAAARRDGVKPRQRAPKLLLVPHAAYRYSGDVAARAYALLAPARERVRRVVLLGPAHRVALRGLAAPRARAFETPLGRVATDDAALAQLSGLPQLLRSDEAHAQEHALEVQLPFLQTLLGNGFGLLPLAVGEARADEVDEVLERLWGGDETLIVVSSDLSHFLPYDEARLRDQQTVQRILTLSGGLRGDDACGAAALNGALRAARRHGLQPRLLDLRNSADTAGTDHGRVVGYGAVAFTAPDDDVGDVDVIDRVATDAATAPADPALGRALTALARAEIAGALGLACPRAPGHPRLHEPAASFVSLHDATGQLRGCVGQLEALPPLGEGVRHNAWSAAFRDHRFAPLTADEWPGLQVEVSVLGALQPLPAAAGLDDAAALLRPGVDGVLLEGAGRRGTFLPQVWASLPEPREFLQALLHKAGLQHSGWNAGIRLWRYGVTVYR